MATEWLSIESAPRDGTPIWAGFNPRYLVEGQRRKWCSSHGRWLLDFGNGEWVPTAGGHPTHWIPLP